MKLGHSPPLPPPQFSSWSAYCYLQIVLVQKGESVTCFSSSSKSSDNKVPKSTKGAERSCFCFRAVCLVSVHRVFTLLLLVVYLEGEYDMMSCSGVKFPAKRRRKRPGSARVSSFRLAMTALGSRSLSRISRISLSLSHETYLVWTREHRVKCRVIPALTLTLGCE